jgi:hypothetical protein
MCACLQVLCIAEQIKFCDHVESAMSRLVQTLALSTAITCSCTPYTLTAHNVILVLHTACLQLTFTTACTIDCFINDCFINDGYNRNGVGSLMKPLRTLLDQYTSYHLSTQPLMQLKVETLSI